MMIFELFHYVTNLCRLLVVKVQNITMSLELECGAGESAPSAGSHELGMPLEWIGSISPKRPSDVQQPREGSKGRTTWRSAMMANVKKKMSLS